MGTLLKGPNPSTQKITTPQTKTSFKSIFIWLACFLSLCLLACFFSSRALLGRACLLALFACLLDCLLACSAGLLACSTKDSSIHPRFFIDLTISNFPERKNTRRKISFFDLDLIEINRETITNDKKSNCQADSAFKPKCKNT